MDKQNEDIAKLKTNKVKLFLDDKIFPYEVFTRTLDPLYEINEEWHIVRSYEEFVDFIITNGVPAIISYDHDLDPEHMQDSDSDVIPYLNYTTKCGYDVAKFLVKYCRENEISLPEYFVHSRNIAGAENIRRVLELG